MKNLFFEFPLIYVLIVGLLAFLFFFAEAQAGTTTFDSNAVIEDGNVYDVVVVTGDNTVVDMTGGQITGGLFTYNTSTVNISGGVISQNVKAFHSSFINISGGTISPYYIYAHDNSKVNVSGTADIHWINAWDSSYVNISGGIIDRLESGYSANVNIIDGQIATQLSASSSVPMNILGGDIEDCVTYSGEIKVYGGSIQKLYCCSAINFYGSDFEISFIGGCNGFGELTGILNDDTAINACLLASDTYLYLNFYGNVTVPPVCLNRPIGDINYDCKVNMLDLALLASGWLDCGLDQPEACWE